MVDDASSRDDEEGDEEISPPTLKETPPEIVMVAHNGVRETVH